MMSTQACSSQCAIAMPVAAPCPARPTMCSEPMFEVKMDAPIVIQPALRPARKKSFVSFWIAPIPPGDDADEQKVKRNDYPIEG